MSEPYWVTCPHCRATGQMSDTRLIGTEAFCPVCSEAFVVQPASPPDVAGAATPSSEASRVTADSNGSAPRSSTTKLRTTAILGVVSVVALIAFFFASQQPPVAQLPDPEPKAAPAKEVAIAESVKPQQEQPAPQAEPPAAPKAEQPEIPQPTETVDNIPVDAKRELDLAVNEDNLPALLKLLAHPHAGVREEVANGFTYRFEPNPAIAPALLPRLTDVSPAVREYAIRAALRHGLTVPEVIPALGNVLLTDPSHKMRESAAQALAEIATGDPDRSRAAAIPLLAALQKQDEHGVVEQAVILAVGSLGAAAQPGVPILVKLARDSNKQEQAVRALAQLGHFETFPAIFADQQRDHFLEKYEMAAGIGRLRPMSPKGLTIIKLLAEDKDRMVRERAIEALAETEPKLPEGWPLLEKAQSDPERTVRDAAAKGIALYGDDPVRKMRSLLTQMLKTEDETWDDSKLADAIQSLGTKGFGALVQILQDPQSTPEIRTAAGQVIAMNWNGDWYDAKHLEVLKKMYLEPQQSLTMRTACAIALLNLDQEQPDITAPPRPNYTATLLAAMRDPSVDFQVRAAAALDASNRIARDPEFLQTLLAAAKECEAAAPADLSEFEQRKRLSFHYSVIYAMRPLPPGSESQIIPHLVVAARHKDQSLRYLALIATEELSEGTPEIVELLRELLKAKDHQILEKVFAAIGRHHRVAAPLIPELRAALKSEFRNIRTFAVQALGEFGPEAVDAVPDLIKLRLDEQNGADNVAAALSEIAPGDEAVVAALVQMLDAPESREDATKGLSEIGPAAGVAVPKLRKLLPESTGGLRLSILTALGAMGEAAKPALPDLIHELSDPDKNVRWTTVRALGELKQFAEPALPDLVKLLHDPDENVQSAVLDSLEQMGPVAKPTIPDLEKWMTTTSNEELKKACAGLLMQLKSDGVDSDQPGSREGEGPRGYPAEPRAT